MNSKFNDKKPSGSIIVWLIAAVLIVGFLALVLLWPSDAKAEGRNSGPSSFSQSESGAVADVSVNTGAAAGVVINNIPQEAGVDGTTYSEARLENAPSLGGLALGGGHPCAYSPSTAQISVIGGGAGFGAMKVDSACMLMVMGAAGDPRAYNAAQYMLAARDPAACKAMQASGMVADCVESGGLLRPRQQPSSFTASAKNATMPAKCAMQGEKVVIRYVAGDKAAQKANCLNSLGF